MRRWLVLGRLLAVRPLTARPLRAALSCVGIAAGVTLVLSIQLINTAVTDSVVGSVRAVSGRATAEVAAPTDGGIDLTVERTLEELDDVAAAVPLIRADGVVRAGAKPATVVTLIGAGIDIAALAPDARAARLDGSFGTPEKPGAVLTEPLARELRAGIGDTIELAARTARARVSVSGILRGGPLAEPGAGRFVLMELGQAQRFLGLPGRVDQILVVPAPGVSEDRLREAVTDAVPDDLVVRDPADRATQADRVLRSIRQLLTLASTVALFVGIFVVYNTMTMATTERRRELALLRALGLLRREEQRLLIAEAGVLGTVGSLAGLAGGYGLAELLVARVAEGYQILLVLPPVDVQPQPRTTAIAFASGLVAAVVAAVLPARRLRHVAPVEGMRTVNPTEDSSEEGAWTWRHAMRVAVPALVVGLGGMAVFVTVARDHVGWAVLGLAGMLLALAAVVPVVVPRVIAVAARPVLARSPLVGRLAEQSLLRSPRRTSYTVGALLVTLMLVIGLGGALSSFRTSLDRLIALVARGDVYVVPPDAVTTTLPAELGPQLAALPSVENAWRFRLTPVLWDTRQVAMQAWDMAAFRRHASISLVDGDVEPAWDAAIAGTGLIVSTTLADERDLELGDSVALPTPRGPVSMRVVGVSNDFLPQGTFYLDWPVAQRLYGDAGAASIAVVAKDSIAAARRDISQYLARNGVAADLESRQQRGDAVLAGIDRTFALADGVQLAGLVVAFVAVVNTLLMVVVERRREIGVLRALGFLRRQVRRVVMAEALVIGVVGGSLASVAGYFLSLLVTKAMEVGNGWEQVAVVPWRLMVAAPFGAAAVAALAGWLPARRAARTNIVDAIRSE